MGNEKQASVFLDTSHNEIFDKEGILVLPLLSVNEIKTVAHCLPNVITQLNRPFFSFYHVC